MTQVQTQKAATPESLPRVERIEPKAEPTPSRPGWVNTPRVDIDDDPYADVPCTD